MNPTCYSEGKASLLDVADLTWVPLARVRLSCHRRCVHNPLRVLTIQSPALQ